MTPEQRKRQLEVLAQLEGGTAATDAAEQPGGSLPTPDFVPEVSDDLPIAGPTRRIIVPRRAAPSVAEPERLAPPVDDELITAKSGDVDAFNDRATETALRQIVGGITRTPVPTSVTPMGTSEKDLLGRRRQAQLDALRQLEAGNNAARTEAYLKTNEAAGPRADRKLSLDEEEAKRREARTEAERILKEQMAEEAKRHNKVSEGIGWKNASKPTGGPVDENGKTIPERRQELRENALKPRGGWEPIEPSAPVFRSSQDGSKFDVAVASMGAIRNHRDHVLEGLEELKHARNPAEADIVLAKINAQMGALASKLRDAEGLNNTDASNHAVDTMLSLTGGSIVNLRNVANQGRLPAILNAAINSGEANLNTLAESNNLRRAKAAGQKPTGEGARKIVKNPKTGERRYLNADGTLAEAVP